MLVFEFMITIEVPMLITDRIVFEIEKCGVLIACSNTTPFPVFWWSFTSCSFTHSQLNTGRP